MGHGKARAAEAVFLHGIAVILARDGDLSRGQFLHRVIAAPVAELQLIGLRSAGKRQELMSQADAEQGNSSPKCRERPDHLRHIRRVSRPVGDEDAVRRQGEDLLRWRIEGHHGHVAVIPIQHPDDVQLQAAVDHHHVKPGIGGPAVPLFCAASSPHRIPRHRRLFDSPDRLRRRGSDAGDHSPPGSEVPDAAHQLPGIHPADPRNATVRQQLPHRFHRPEIRRILIDIPHNERRGGNDPALVILPSDAVIPDKRIRHHHSLIRVGRIRENLLVAGHGGVEHHLADHILFRPEADTGVFASVLQHQFPVIFRQILTLSLHLLPPVFSPRSSAAPGRCTA